MDELKHDAEVLFDLMVKNNDNKIRFSKLIDLREEEGKQLDDILYRQLIKSCDAEGTRSLSQHQLTHLMSILRYSDFTNPLTILFYILDNEICGFITKSAVIESLKKLNLHVDEDVEMLIDAISSTPERFQLGEFLTAVQEVRDF